MADNVTTPGVGTVLATDEIGGVHFPRSKVAWGADGSATDVSDDAPLPVGDGDLLAALNAFVAAIKPASQVFDIIPHDTNPLPVITRGIVVKEAGSAVLRAKGSSADVTFANLPEGFQAPWEIEYVRESGTNAVLAGLA